MNSRRLLPVLALLALSFTHCRSLKSAGGRLPVAEVVAEDFLTCFDAGPADAKLWCEASAVLVQDERVYVASDKDQPAPNAAVFYRTGSVTQLADTTRKPSYLPVPVLRAARKFEDFARTPDGKWVFLTTAFDRVKPGATDWDAYNTLLCWQPGQEAGAQVVAPRPGQPTSVGLRPAISRALGGLPYFKVEGLAATDTELIWAIREEGQTFERFAYTVKFLQTPYRIRPDSAGTLRVVLPDTAFTVLRTFDLTAVCAANGLVSPLGVSSVEYDPGRRGFWVLTSYEQPGRLGAYLWFMSAAAARGQGELQLIRTADGKPLAFSHKAEDLALTDANTLLVIHDDDREKTTIGTRIRQPNQAAYTILRLR